MSKIEDAREAILDAIIETAGKIDKGGDVRNLAGAYEALVAAENSQLTQGVS